MNEQNELGEVYSDFHRIDLDMRGGYGRVAEVFALRSQDKFPQRAFKLLRHENDFQVGFDRFIQEQLLLSSINEDQTAPLPITKIFDSGFADIELSQALHQKDTPNPRIPIYSTGNNTEHFKNTGKELHKKEPGRWLPYLVVELAPYDDNLLRQIRHLPKDNATMSDLYRLPTGEVIAMAVQLLDTIEYLHKTYKRAYMDWKPEHIFWNGFNKQVKLIDWNVTEPLEKGLGVKRNILDDIRLLCVTILYIGLTFNDPDDPTKPIGPRPTEEYENPISEIRLRYWTDNPNFYRRDSTLDEKIKGIIRKGLNPKQGYESPTELKAVLLDYAKQEWDVTPAELLPNSAAESQYFKWLSELRMTQYQLLQTQQSLFKAFETKGVTHELSWLSEMIKQTLVNIPGS